jgi:hypothetical protein
MAVRALLLIAIMFLAVSCSEDRQRGELTFSESPSNALTVSQAIDPQNAGRAITVRGTVHAVCKDEGCWMVITDGRSRLRMTFEEAEFNVPMDLAGEVVVQGIVREELVPLETAQAILPSLGFTPEQIDTLQGDQRIPLMVAQGVLLPE